MLILSRHIDPPPHCKIFEESDKKILSLSLVNDWTFWHTYVESYISEIHDVDRVLIDIKYEAPFNSIFDKIKYFIETNNLDVDKFLVIDAGIDRLKNLNSVYYPSFFYEGGGFIKYLPLKERTHYFVSLARIPRPSRVLLTQEYYKRNIFKKGIISCHTDLVGSNYQILNLIDDRFKIYFPAKITEEGNLTREQASQFHNLYFCNAIFNIVLESSFEKMSFEDSPCYWDRLFITEKTIKAFAYHQIPIFLATMNHVKKLRELGFDVFDDIVDHSYDLEPNVEYRIQKIADEIERICNLDFEILKTLDIQKRLEHNADQVGVVFKQKEQEYLEKIQQFLG